MSSAKKTQNAIELLKADHREVDQLFEKFKSAKGRSQRKMLIEKIAIALNAHTMLEEEIFYPACSEHGIEEDDLDEAQVEHDTLKLLVRELVNGHLDDDYYDAKVTVLSEYVKHHVEEEEEPEKGIFARAEKAGLDLVELGHEIKERKEELMEDEERLLARPPRIRSLHIAIRSPHHHASAPRHSEDRDHRQHAPGHDYDDRRFSDPSHHQGSHGYDRDPRHYDSQQGHGGWQGDHQRHFEAGRRGWRGRD